MDEMDIEQIPDTPERKSSQNITGLQFGKESNAFAGHAKNANFLHEECLNQRRSTDKSVLDNGHNRKGPLHFRGRQPINFDEIEPRNNSVAFSSSGNSCTTAGGSLFRRASYDAFKHGATHGIGAHAIDKGKAVQNKKPSDLPVFLGNNDIFDLTPQDEHKQMHGTVSPLVGSNSLQIRRTTEDVTSESGSFRHLPPTSITSNAFKGKEKIDVSCDVSGSAVDQGKKIHPFTGSHLPVTSPRVTGQKRLVRNGYISPHNIASRAQKLAESLQASSTTADKNHVANVSDDPSHRDISEIVAEDCSYNRAKGKGVVNHPPNPKERDAQNIHVSTSSVNGVSDQMGEVGKEKMLNGWRRTHNHVKKPNETSRNVVDGCLLERDDGVRNPVSEQHENCMAKTDCERINIARVESSLDKSSGRSYGASKLAKRQRKHGLTSRNHGERSTMAPDDSEIIFLGSSREPSSSRSSRSRTFQPERNLYPIYEIDEPSHDMENNNSQDSGYMNNDDSEARASQLEADEMFARELQEQLYNETPLFDEHQIDENVAWSLQQMDDLLPAAYNRNRPVSRPRSSATVHSNRQPRTRSSTNPSSRRGASARGPTNRSQLRNHIFNQSPTAGSRVRNNFPASRGRNFHFPLEMDLDMRLDILEALEAAVGDFSDMSMNTDHMLQVQRDFNENDYEMLLALDDNNHQRGASVNQINGLPESVVQADNFEEACAICLETPTRGETIRHLPCLHKFHKDCIDPWLRRKTSCPVCKSSIT